MEIWALNRSNLFFCLDETAINPRPINCKLPRLKLSQVMAANHMRGVLSYKYGPPDNEKRASLLQSPLQLWLLVRCSETLVRSPAANFSTASQVAFLFLSREERDLECVFFFSNKTLSFDRPWT